jgi:alpha-N-arabinofuranosidase
MQKILLYLLVWSTLSLTAQNAKIKIDPERVIGEIDPKIYGVFMEPIEFNGRRMGLPDSVRFNTLYGTLYDPKSPLANKDGFKTNFIE